MAVEPTPESDVVLDDRADDGLRALTLDVDADDLLEELRSRDAYLTETTHTVETDVMLLVDGYGPVSVSLWPVSGTVEERAFEDYFQPRSLAEFVADDGDEQAEKAAYTAAVFVPYRRGRRDRLDACAGYVVEVAEILTE